jgi:protocatechuate 3,4-dioxygenase beta subunit
MNSDHSSLIRHASTLHRRRFLRQAMLGSAAFFTVKGAFAEQLVRTPRQTEGPFYPDTLPLDTDNDLLILNDGLTPAIGEIAHLTGRVLDGSGQPMRNATVEIWQCDHAGNYLHSRGENPKAKGKRDSNFQGYGRFLTASTGDYYFRTIKPVPYPGRSPHIHVIVKQGEKTLLTTQCYIKGHELNEKDGIVRRLKSDPKVLDSVMVDFQPVKGSKAGECGGRFDIVLGTTPEDSKDDPFSSRRRGA